MDYYYIHSNLASLDAQNERQTEQYLDTAKMF